MSIDAVCRGLWFLVSGLASLQAFNVVYARGYIAVMLVSCTMVVLGLPLSRCCAVRRHLSILALGVMAAAVFVKL